MKKVFILSWPSWVGKTTIYYMYIQKYPGTKIQKIITTTTRAKREYEQHAKDYYFVSIDEFKQFIKQKKFIEYAEVHDNFYWSTYTELENIILIWKIPFYIVDPWWVKFLKTKLYWIYDVKTIFILPPSIDELRKRLIKRWEDENSKNFQIRLDESLIWIEERNYYDYIIVNHDLEKSVQELDNIIKNFK